MCPPHTGYTHKRKKGPERADSAGTSTRTSYPFHTDNDNPRPKSKAKAKPKGRNNLKRGRPPEAELEAARQAVLRTRAAAQAPFDPT